MQSTVPAIDAMLENAKEAARRRGEAAVPIQKKRMKLRPRHEWVVVRKIDPKDKLSEAGLVITEGQARSSMGEVVSFSPKVADLVRGDLVLFTNFAIKLEEMEDATGDKDLYLVREEEIYTVLEDDE